MTKKIFFSNSTQNLGVSHGKLGSTHPFPAELFALFTFFLKFSSLWATLGDAVINNKIINETKICIETFVIWRLLFLGDL